MEVNCYVFQGVDPLSHDKNMLFNYYDSTSAKQTIALFLLKFNWKKQTYSYLFNTA